MIDVSRMLLIAAAGRGCDATKLAVALIEKEAPRNFVVAVRFAADQAIDTLKSAAEEEAACGARSSFAHGYTIVEERAAESADTARMKQAGAQRVLLLRTSRNHAAEAVALREHTLPTGACVISVSSSAQTIMHSGPFVIVRNAKSCDAADLNPAALPSADRVITFGGRNWNFSPDGFRFENGRWIVPMAVSAAILTGGQSSRMGRTKSLLPFRGRTLLETIVDQVAPLVDETLISANDSGKYAFLGLPIVVDERPDEGPLMGIASCLSASAHDRLFVTACDVPELPAEFVRAMVRCSSIPDIVMPVDPNGRVLPLPAVFRRSVLPVARNLLNRGSRRVRDLCRAPELRVSYFPLEHCDWYRNLNTPSDYMEMQGESA